MGQFQSPDTLRDCAGESSLFMAEEFAFQKPHGIAEQFSLTKVLPRRGLS